MIVVSTTVVRLSPETAPGALPLEKFDLIPKVYSLVIQY